MCISLKNVIDKIFFNILSNKNQVAPLTRLLFRFNKLLKIDCDKSMNILVECLNTSLVLIVVNKNEKMLQNYLNFLKLCLKNNYDIVDPNEFYAKIINKYFNLNVIDIDCLAIVLEIYDALIKYINLDLSQIIFFIELFTNLRSRCFEKQSDLNKFLNLCEKCLVIIKKMVKLIDNSKLNSNGIFNNF